MIIGLCGHKGSGKDTVAAYLVKQYQFERKAFADPLKKSVAALLDIPFHEVDKLKNDPDKHLVLEGTRRMTFRSFLQRYGTEAHRDVFGEDFWLDHTLPIDGYYPGRKIVVTDVRFENEVDRVTKLGGKIVQVHRTKGPRIQDFHPSEEIDFKADYVIYNEASLDDLFAYTEDMLNWALELDAA